MFSPCSNSLSLSLSRSCKDSRGFTLVELMIVIAIIGILGTALFPTMTKYLMRSRDAARISDIQSIQTALSAYHVDQEKYPPATASGCMNNTVLSTNYIAKGVPMSPRGITYDEGCGNNGHYGYGLSSGTGMFYILTARMENAYGGNYSGSMFGMTGTAEPIGFFNTKYNTIKGSGEWFLASSDGISYNATWATVPATLVPVNGGWSSWSSCTGTCGTTGNQYRLCDNPATQNGGTDCTGPSLQSCVMPACVNYTITFDSASGSSVSPITGVAGSTVTAPTPPTRAGYTFGGWSPALPSIMPSENATYVAQWTPSSPYAVCTAASQTYTATTTYPGCNEADKIVCTGTNTGYTWAMCNVGSTTAGTTSASYGSYFQWGRNVAFPTSGSVTTVAGPLSASAASATTDFIINGSTAPYDWLTPKDDTLWGTASSDTIATWENSSSANQNKMQGPCPSGYHVPTYKETNDTANQLAGGAWMTTLKAPLSGNRDNSDGSLSYQDSYGYWWLASPYSAYGRVVHWDTSYVFPSDSTFRTYGFAVRCVKN